MPTNDPHEPPADLRDVYVSTLEQTVRNLTLDNAALVELLTSRGVDPARLTFLTNLQREVSRRELAESEQMRADLSAELQRVRSRLFNLIAAVRSLLVELQHHHDHVTPKNFRGELFCEWGALEDLLQIIDPQKE